MIKVLPELLWIEPARRQTDLVQRAPEGADTWAQYRAEATSKYALPCSMTAPEAEALVRRICLSFPVTEERTSHGHPAWFIRGKKQFASFHTAHHEVTRVHIWCAAPPGAQEALVVREPSRYFRPPYVGHRGWLGMFLDGWFEPAVLEGVLTEAYLAVCPPALRSRFEDGAG